MPETLILHEKDNVAILTAKTLPAMSGQRSTLLSRTAGRAPLSWTVKIRMAAS